jgi:membrane-bound metal-dependent hydrolase YbcI (DUF457 family)
MMTGKTHAIVGATAAMFFLVGYGSHMLLDMLTMRGIALFYPLNKSRIGLKFCKTDGTIEHMVRYLAVVAVLLILLNRFVR